MDVSTTLFYKAKLSVKPGVSCENLLEEAHKAIYTYCTSMMDVWPSRQQFSIGGHYESEDQAVRAAWASHHDNAQDSKTSATQWAVRIRARDPGYKRRTWTISIALRQQNEHALSLYYAVYYTDYLAQSFSVAVPPTQQHAPSFLQAFLADNRFNCEAAAGYPLIDKALDLAENLEACYEVLMHAQRSVPFILVTCPDLIDPHWIAEMTIGNSIVCYTSNYDTSIRFAFMLPDGLSFGEDAVTVFMPANTYARTLHSDEIKRLGEIAIIRLLRQAFCQNVRTEERKDFLTYDDLIRLRDLSRALQAAELAQRLKEERSKVTVQLKDKEKLIEELEADLNTAKAKGDRDLLQDIKEYEEVLSATMHERDEIKQLLATITTSLYDPDFQFTPLHSGHDIVEDLIFAIAIRLTSPNAHEGKKKCRVPL